MTTTAESATKRSDDRQLVERQVLHWLIERGDSDGIRRELAAAADIEAKDWQGNMPLHWVARRGANYALDMLIKAGTDVSDRLPEGGAIPLHEAATEESRRWLRNCWRQELIRWRKTSIV